MTKLTKAQEKEKADHMAAISEKRSALESAISKFNAMIFDEKDEVTAALGELNDAISDADDFRCGIADAQQSHFDDKSDRWQEGDRGQSYLSWKDEWENGLVEVRVEFPHEIDEPECDAIEILEGLASQPD